MGRETAPGPRKSSSRRLAVSLGFRVQGYVHEISLSLLKGCEVRSIPLLKGRSDDQQY